MTIPLPLIGFVAGLIGGGIGGHWGFKGWLAGVASAILLVMVLMYLGA